MRIAEIQASGSKFVCGERVGVGRLEGGMMIVRDALYIDGRWLTQRGEQMLDVVDPSTARVFGCVPQASGEDVDAAVEAAASAFNGWSRMAPAERSVILGRVTAELTARAEQLTRLIAMEVGMPLKMTARVQVGGPLNHWQAYTRLAEQFVFEQKVGNSLVVREAAGVVAAITPWNFPLSQITLKVAAALAAGCTVVLKPSEVAPLNAFLLAEAIDAAGLPPGVFNLVTGIGAVTGEQLVTHTGVNLISFTGSTRVGRRIGELAGGAIRKATLELGGKSAAVILDDADLGKAVRSTVGNCFLNSGQTCSAHTRLLVPRDRLDESLSLAKESAERFRVGPALAEGSMLGPLISAVQRDRVLDYIRRGILEGGKLVCGGLERPEGLSDGFFVRPTVFAVEDPYAIIAQEEIFGPVLTVIPHNGDDDAIRVANATPYGLAGAVWAGSECRALAVARQLRAGQVDVNGGAWNPAAPFGGFGLSGIGREGGVYGLEEFLEYKAIQFSGSVENRVGYRA